MEYLSHTSLLLRKFILIIIMIFIIIMEIIFTMFFIEKFV